MIGQSLYLGQSGQLACTQLDRQTVERETDRQTGQTDRQTVERVRQTGQRDRQTVERETDRQTDKQ